MPFVQKKCPLGCDPTQCVANFASGQFANDQQRLYFNNGVSAVAHNNMNMRRGMVANVHQDAAIRKSQQSRHIRKYRATIALPCSYEYVSAFSAAALAWMAVVSRSGVN